MRYGEFKRAETKIVCRMQKYYIPNKSGGDGKQWMEYYVYG